MSVQKVKEFFRQNGYDFTIVETEESTATVELAAKARKVEPDQIAKTLSFKLADENILIVASGLARIDNKKYKEFFGQKASMLKADEVVKCTGFPVGGVCPFGLATNMKIYLDKSLQKHIIVCPATGAVNASTTMTVNELEQLTKGQWIDVCK